MSRLTEKDRTRITSAATANVLVDLGREATERVLARVLSPRPALVGLQEWGADRDDLLDAHGDYDWCRPGAMPVGIRRDIGRITGSDRITLARSRDGVRTTYATEARIREHNGREHAVLNLHLVAHHDRPAYLDAWEEGRRTVEAWVRRQQRGVQPWVLGDVNKHDLDFKGLVSCWHTNRLKPTFGPRTIDGIWTTVRADDADTIDTASDHHAVLARYRSIPPERS